MSKVLKRCSGTLVAMCCGLVLFLIGLESIEYRGVVPTIPNWFGAVICLPVLVTESARGGLALLVVLYVLQCALLGCVVDWLRAAFPRSTRILS